MPYLPVITLEENNSIGVYAVNPSSLMDFYLKTKTLYFLNKKDIIEMKSYSDTDVKFIGIINQKESFCISDEFNNQHLLHLNTLENLEQFVKFDETTKLKIDVTHYNLIIVKPKKKIMNVSYSVGYSLEKDILTFYSIEPSNKDLLYRLMGNTDIKANDNNKKYFLPVTPNKLFSKHDVPKLLDIINYLANSVNISEPLEYLNIILIREFFSKNTIADPLSLCTTALNEKTKFLLHTDIKVLPSEKYLLLFSYNHYSKNIDFHVVEESIVHKTNSRFVFGYVDEDAFDTFKHELSTADRKKIFKFNLQRSNGIYTLKEEHVLDFLTYLFKNSIRVNLNTSLENLTQLIYEIEESLAEIKKQHLFSIHSSSLFFNNVIAEKMKENKLVNRIFYMQ